MTDQLHLQLLERNVTIITFPRLSSVMAYNHYTEEDSLLPKYKGAPEIKGSRPQSINDDIVEEQVSDYDGQIRTSEKSPSNWIHVLFGICFFASIFLILLYPDGPLGDLFGEHRPVPKTLQERVDRVLEDTPLIGTYSCLVDSDWLLILYRWAQRSSVHAEIFLWKSYLWRGFQTVVRGRWGIWSRRLTSIETGEKRGSFLECICTLP